MSAIRFEKSDENRVTVRVWLSNLSGKSLGHVSLETYVGGKHDEGYYMSHWPKDGITLFHDVTKPSIFHSYKDDLRKGEADVTIHLYSLNVREINKAFRSFRASGSNWDLFGSTFFRDENARNCSGLSAHLLSRGGINELMQYYDEFLSGNVGAITGLSGGAFFGGSAIVGVSSAGLGVAGGVAIGGPIVIAFAAVGFLISGTVGALAGGTAGMLTDAARGMKHIVTPTGVATLVQFAKEAEKQKYGSLQSAKTQDPNSDKCLVM